MPWVLSDPNDHDSPRKYVLSEKNGELIERNPDKLPSFHRLLAEDTVCYMEVITEGVLVFREYDETLCCSLFTWDEIRFD